MWLYHGTRPDSEQRIKVKVRGLRCIALPDVSCAGPPQARATPTRIPPTRIQPTRIQPILSILHRGPRGQHCICTMFWLDLHRTQGGFTASDTVGLVVEYAPATGETRVRFPDGVVCLQKERPFLFLTKKQSASLQQAVILCSSGPGRGTEFWQGHRIRFRAHLHSPFDYKNVCRIVWSGSVNQAGLFPATRWRLRRRPLSTRCLGPVYGPPYSEAGSRCRGSRSAAASAFKFPFQSIDGIITVPSQW